MTPVLPAQFGMVGARREHLERLRGYGFRRVETVLLATEEVPWLRAYLAGMEHGFSFHCPAFHRDDYPEYPLLAALVDPVPARREQALALMCRELEQAAAWGARYLVAHLQRNLLMEGETPPAGQGEREGVALAVEMVGRLLEHSRAIGVPVHLENMMGCPLFAGPEAYRALGEALPQVRYCLDVGHAALEGRRCGFPEAELAAAMAPWVASVHLYDNHMPAHVDFGALRESGLLRKYPVDPRRSGTGDWLDAVGCLRATLAEQPEALVTFEVYYRLDEDHAATAAGLARTVALCAEITGRAADDGPGA